MVRLLYPEEMTPVAQRMWTALADEAESVTPSSAEDGEER